VADRNRAQGPVLAEETDFDKGEGRRETSIGVNPGGWGHDPQIWGWGAVGVVGSPWNIVVFYDAQEYDITFQKG